MEGKKKAKSDHSPKHTAHSSSSSAVNGVPVERTILSHFAAAPKRAPVLIEQQKENVPNKSIIPDNESEEDRLKRLSIEKMFEDEGNENQTPNENIGQKIDPKGKGLMYPSESLKNQELVE